MLLVRWRFGEARHLRSGPPRDESESRGMHRSDSGRSFRAVRGKRRCIETALCCDAGQYERVPRLVTVATRVVVLHPS